MNRRIAPSTASRTLYPPSAHMQMCIKAGCIRTAKGYALKKAEARTVWLYTLDEGPLPAYAVHLYCEGKPAFNSDVQVVLISMLSLECKITYHHNFSVSEHEDGVYQRSYYDQDIPDIIQASEHRFVERKVINLWVTLMLVSWLVV